MGSGQSLARRSGRTWSRREVAGGLWGPGQGWVQTQRPMGHPRALGAVRSGRPSRGSPAAGARPPLPAPGLGKGLRAAHQHPRAQADLHDPRPSSCPALLRLMTCQQPGLHLRRGKAFRQLVRVRVAGKYCFRAERVPFGRSLVSWGQRCLWPWSGGPLAVGPWGSRWAPLECQLDAHSEGSCLTWLLSYGMGAGGGQRWLMVTPW